MSENREITGNEGRETGNGQHLKAQGHEAALHYRAQQKGLLDSLAQRGILLAQGNPYWIGSTHRARLG